MAHKIIGIDLGAYSVKVAELEAGFRQAHLIGLYERRLEEREEGESELACATRTLALLLAEERLEPEMCASALAGAEATLRVITLPFSDPKKIEQVIGYELESQILGDLEGLVVDTAVATSKPGATQVVAVAARHDDIAALIEALAAVGAEPRMVGEAALAPAALGEHANVGEEAQLILDIGHQRSRVCAIQGRTLLFARTIGRGGADVTRAIADHFKMSLPDAERAKHEQAFIADATTKLESPAHQRAEAVVREAVRPLLRELKQTLAAARTGAEAPFARLLLCGGGARLNGLLEHLEAELGLPVARLELRLGDDPGQPELREFEGARTLAFPAQALGIALAAAAPAPQVNLRRGDLAYRADFSYLRGKVAYLGLCLLALLAFAAVNAAASLHVLRQEGQQLQAQLREETVALFGEPRLDGHEVSMDLRHGPKGGVPQIPTMTALDLLDAISQAVPPPEKGKLDLSELDIKPKKIYLKGTAESMQQVEDIATALGKIDCFDNVQTGKITSVTAPPTGDNTSGDKPSQVQQFTLDIATSCE